MTVNDLIKFFKNVPSDYEVTTVFYLEKNEEGEITSDGFGINLHEIVNDQKNKRVIFPIFFESFLKVNDFYCKLLAQAQKIKEEFDKNNSN